MNCRLNFQKPAGTMSIVRRLLSLIMVDDNAANITARGGGWMDGWRRCLDAAGGCVEWSYSSGWRRGMALSF